MSPKALKVPTPKGHFSCDYLISPKMCYYNLDGIEMPCCFIKDTSTFDGLPAMLSDNVAEYVIQQNGGAKGSQSFYIYLMLGDDRIWRIDGM